MSMDNRAIPYVIALAIVLMPLSAFADCDTIDAYVQVGYSSSEYYSGVVGRCYSGGMYGDGVDRTLEARSFRARAVGFLVVDRESVPSTGCRHGESNFLCFTAP